jgi:hypothetical protein
MAESNTVLGAGLHSLCDKWKQMSHLTNTDEVPAKISTQASPSQSPSIPPQGESPPVVPPAIPSLTVKMQEAVRIPENQDVTSQDKLCSTPPLRIGRELRDISVAVDKLLLNSEREEDAASCCSTDQGRPRSRRLILSLQAEQLPLEDERAAAQGYAALVAREEALAAAARAASRREADAVAAAAAAEAETAAAWRDVERLHEAARAMREQRRAPFLPVY